MMLPFFVCPRSLRITGGIWSRAILWCQSNFITINPGCHGNGNISYTSRVIANFVVNSSVIYRLPNHPGTKQKKMATCAFAFVILLGLI